MHFNWLISDHCQAEMESAQWLPRNVQLFTKLETAPLTPVLDTWGCKFKLISSLTK